MMKNLLLCAILVASLIASQVSASTIEDAEQSLSELNDNMLEAQGELHLYMNNQSDILRGLLDEILSIAQQDIEVQINAIKSNILIIVGNTNSSTQQNVSECLGTSGEDLENFRSELKDELQECYGDTIMTGNNMLYSTWSKVWYEYDINYQCTKMQLEECKNYEQEGCVDMVLNSIQSSKDTIAPTLEMLKTEMENAIITMNIPCRQMIVDVALYPSLILDLVQSCLRIFRAYTLPKVC